MLIKVPQPQLLEGYSINTIQQQNPDFLLPVTSSNMNNTAVLMYKIDEKTKNVRYMDPSVTMQQGANLLQNMIGNLIRLKNWNLDYHKICFDARCIYLNKVSGKVYFTYLPMTDYSVSDMEIKQYLYGITNAFNISDNIQGKQRLLQCFTDDVTLEELHQKVQNICDSGMSGVKAASMQPQIPVQPKVPVQPQVRPQMPIQPQVSAQPKVQPQGFYLELIQSEMPGVPRRIDLDPMKGNIVIGRASQSEQQPDVVFPSECKGIGRKHARIEYRTGCFYLIDMNSVNHTFLNGQQLSAEQPYALSPGCEVTFTKTKPVRYRMVRE